MNSLSWFLYFADVFVSLKHFLLIFSVFGTIIIGIFTLYYYFDDDKNYFAWLLLPLISAFLYCIIPSKNTMYAIAASELGEEALKSNIAQKSLVALEQWIDSQIEGKK